MGGVELQLCVVVVGRGRCACRQERWLTGALAGGSARWRFRWQQHGVCPLNFRVTVLLR